MISSSTSSCLTKFEQIYNRYYVESVKIFDHNNNTDRMLLGKESTNWKVAKVAIVIFTAFIGPFIFFGLLKGALLLQERLTISAPVLIDPAPPSPPLDSLSQLSEIVDELKNKFPNLREVPEPLSEATQNYNRVRSVECILRANMLIADAVEASQIQTVKHLAQIINLANEANESEREEIQSLANDALVHVKRIFSFD